MHVHSFNVQCWMCVYYYYWICEDVNKKNKRTNRYFRNYLLNVECVWLKCIQQWSSQVWSLESHHHSSLVNDFYFNIVYTIRAPKLELHLSLQNDEQIKFEIEHFLFEFCRMKNFEIHIVYCSLLFVVHGFRNCIASGHGYL